MNTSTALTLYRIMHELDAIYEQIKREEYTPGVYGAAVAVSIAAKRVEDTAEKMLDAREWGEKAINAP